MENNHTNIVKYLAVLRYLLIFGYALSAAVVCVGLGGIVASILRPAVDPAALYRVWTLLRAAGFGWLFICLAAAYAGHSLSTRIPKSLTKYTISKWDQLIVGIASAFFFLLAGHTLNTGFTNVRPLAHSWISTSKAGPREISETTAIEYLWLGIRFSSSVFLSGIGLVAGFAAKSSLQAISVPRKNTPVAKH